MLMIRLQRKGKKNQPFFKIVVTEKEKSSTRGRFVEELGFYNPLTKEKSLKQDRAKYWMSVGAKPSDTLYNMLISENVIEGTKRPQHKKSKKKQSEAEASAPTAAPETPAEQPSQEPVKEEQPSQPEEQPKEVEKPEQPATEEPAKDPTKTEEPIEEPKKEEQAPEEPKAEPLTS